VPEAIFSNIDDTALSVLSEFYYLLRAVSKAFKRSRAVAVQDYVGGLQ